MAAPMEPAPVLAPERGPNRGPRTQRGGAFWIVPLPILAAPNIRNPVFLRLPAAPTAEDRFAGFFLLQPLPLTRIAARTFLWDARPVPSSRHSLTGRAT